MIELSMNEQFAIHATAIAIKEFDREELEKRSLAMQKSSKTASGRRRYGLEKICIIDYLIYFPALTFITYNLHE